MACAITRYPCRSRARADAPRHRAALDRGRAWPRGRAVAIGAGRPVHPPDRYAADALLGELAYAGCDARAADYQRDARPGGRYDRLRVRGRLFPRIQEGGWRGAGHLATFARLARFFRSDGIGTVIAA